MSTLTSFVSANYGNKNLIDVLNKGPLTIKLYADFSYDNHKYLDHYSSKPLTGGNTAIWCHQLKRDIVPARARYINCSLEIMMHGGYYWGKCSSVIPVLYETSKCICFNMTLDDRFNIITTPQSALDASVTIRYMR